MADPLEAELVLDTSSAMSQIEELGSSLTDALNQAGDVGGGGGGGGDALASTASGMDQVSESAGKAAASGGQLESSLKGVEGAALLASGHVGGMRTVVQGFGASAVPAVAGALALAGGMGEIVQKGIAGQAATQRFNSILGDMADRVKNVRVGDLNTTIDELSLKLGSVPSATEQASASIFQLGINSGLTKNQAADMTDKIVALAARSVALKPSLGDVGTVAESMGTRLARGGTFAARLGVSLSQTEIAAEAATLGFGTQFSALNAGQKSYAAATLAAQKYGSTMNEDVTKGSQNAEIAQRRFTAVLDTTLEKLGAPLVTPFFQILEAGLPGIEALAQVLSSLATAVMPAVKDAVTVAVPPLKALADVIDALGPALPPLIDAWLAYVAVQKIGIPLWALSQKGLQAIGIGAAEATTPTLALAAAETELETSTLQTITAVTEQGTVLAGGAVDLEAYAAAAATAAEANAAVAETGVAAGAGAAAGGAGFLSGGAGLVAIGAGAIAAKKPLQDALGQVGGLAAEGAVLGTVVLPGLGTAIGAVGGAAIGLAENLLSSGQSLSDYRKQFSDMSSTLDGLNSKQALKTFIDQLGQSDKLGLFAGSAKAVVDELEALASKSPAAAEKVKGALEALRTDSGKPLFDASQAKILDQAVGSTEQKLKDFNTRAQAAAQANQQFAASSTNAAQAQQEEAKGIVAAQQAIVDQIQATLNLQDAISKIGPDVATFNDAVKQHGIFSQEAAAADRQFEQDALNAAKAASDKAAADNGGIQSAQGAAAATNAYVSSLEGVARTLDPGSPLRQQLMGYIEDLLQVPPDKRTTFTLDDADAILKLQALLALLRQIPGISGGQVTVAAGLSGFANAFAAQSAASKPKPPGKALGGPVYPGVSYLVGEHQPEVFTPSVAGTITPNTSGGFVGSTTGGAGGIVLTMNLIVQGHVYGDSHLNEIVTNALNAQNVELARALRAA